MAKGFFDHVLKTEKSYEEKWLYVRENPVWAALAADWETCIYSGEIAPVAFSEDWSATVIDHRYNKR